ncbi:ectin-like [Crassostrea angulata]|uniref:ectin-like n=1 Tax=Magallana angulata TaxID=2784310 RepID=UPI0022B0B3BF|nr:ectin-like [Crassostrea angulata]
MFVHLILVLTFASMSIADTSEKRFLFIPPVVLENWSSWSSCSASCGNTGERHRTRGCHIPFLGTVHWTKCGIGGDEKEACVGICPQTTGATTVLLGTWNPWGLFSPCDKTCGGGIQIRHRTCGSAPCIGDYIESASCNVHQCPVQSTPAASTTQPVTTAATTGTQWISVTTTTKATTTHKKFFTIRSNK